MNKLDFLDTKIGKIVYPCDNSYITNIETGAPAMLYNKPVRVLSGPYWLTYFDVTNNPSTRQFITVEYLKEHYIILNNTQDYPNVRSWHETNYEEAKL